MSPAEGRRFGLTLGGAFTALGAVLWWRGRDAAAAVVFVLGSALLLAAFAVPSRLGPVRRVWLGVGETLSRLTTPVFLALVYFVIIAPIGLVMRVLGRNPLTRHRYAMTSWVSRAEGTRSRRDMEHQF